MRRRDKTDYTLHIQNKLPRLHDQVLPSSHLEFAFLGSNLRTLIEDWKLDGIERGAELERIESSLFYNQLKNNGMEHIEMVSLLMCDILPSIIQNKVYGLMMRAKANSTHSSRIKMLIQVERNGMIY